MLKKLEKYSSIYMKILHFGGSAMNELYQLTYPQKNILNINNLYPDSAISCISGTFKIAGGGNVELLKKAINLYVKNNDGMRIRICMDNTEYFQYISDYFELELEEMEFDNERELYLWEDIESKISMPLLDSQLFYFKVIKIKNGDIGYFIKCSHMISDAWTFTLLANEIMDYYKVLLKGEEAILKDKVSIVEHIKGEETYLTSDRCEKDRKYWGNNLEDIQVKTILKRNNKSSTDAKRVSIVLPSKLSEKIYEYCRENRTSPFNLFASALYMYIKRATNKNDIIIGTTTLNRANAKEKEMAGMFINTCPIRVKVKDNMNFNELVKTVNTTSMALLRHQKFPYELLLNELKERYDFKDNLFDVVLNYQNAKFQNKDNNIDYTTRWHFSGAQIESLIINVNDREDSGQFIVSYDYLKDSFNFKEIEYLHKHMISLLWHALDNDIKPISNIEMLPEEEQDRILSRFNNVELSEELDDIQLEKRESRNVKAYILDSNRIALPIGIPGNLYVSRKTDGEEIDNPYYKGEKLYKTDKIARWYPKGDIEILKSDDSRLLVPKFNMIRPIKTVNTVFVGSFVLEPVKPYIKKIAKVFNYRIVMDFAEYNQVLQELINENSKLSLNKDGVNVILVRLEDYIRDNSGSISEKIDIINETSKRLSELLAKVETTTLLGMFKNSSRITDAMLLNTIKNNTKEILKTVQANKNIFILNTDDIISNYCIEKVFDEGNDKIAHIPYTKELYAGVSAEICRKIIALNRKPYKVIVLDCDNTLWKGVVGESGTYGIEITDSYKELQKFVLQKQKEGMLLTIASKNNIEDVIDVFENNSNMILKKDDIANWKVNWDNKAENIKVMAKELNLGIDSFIFLDDNPMECMNMMASLPEVLTLNVPSEEAIPMFLKHLWATDNLIVTAEDRERSKRYIDELKRKDAEKKVNSFDEFIKELNIRVSMREVSDDEVSRASQMTLRTNQFNLSTVRRTEKEIEEIRNNKEYKVFVVEANDKFGEYGIIGLLILKIEKDIKVDTFLLSCRILGRNVENTILEGLKIFAESLGKGRILFPYVKSEKNQPILNFLDNVPFKAIEKKENTCLYELLTEDISSVENIELLYNECFDKKQENEIEEEKDITNNETKEAVNNKELVLVNNKLIKNATNKEYLLVLKEYTGRKIIDSIENKIIKGEYRKPTTDTEVRLCQIWCDALKLKQVGISNDFFEIGGDSLSAVFVLSQILKEFNVSLGLTDLFTTKTIKEIAELIEKKKKEKYEPIPLAEKREEYELSSAQSRMYLINQIEGATTKYNETHMLKVYGKLDIGRLENAFNEIIKRHEILRTGFYMKDNVPVQKIYDNVKLKIEYVEANEEKAEEIKSNFVNVFELDRPPLLRVTVIKVASSEYIMLFDIHHIVIDGTSFGILINEVLSVYEGRELCKLQKQYKDFAVWQNNQLNSAEMKKQEEFWVKQFEGEIPVLNLPTDFTRPLIQSSKGRKMYFSIDEKTTRKIKNICAETETTLFMFLFAVYNVLLYRYTGQEDITVGIPVAGRDHPDTENMLGMFINNLAIRTYPKGNMSFFDYLIQVKNIIIKCLENQDYQYERLVSKLNLSRDMSRNPLFDVMFALQNMDIPNIKTNDLEFKQLDFDNGTCKQDLSMFVYEREEKLEIEVEFCTDLYRPESICRFNEHYFNCINQLLANTNSKIDEFDFLTSIEKNALKIFNKTEYIYNEDLTVNELFEAQVKKTPNDIAIVFGDKKISYLELNNRANKIAYELRKNGVGANISVGVMIERSIDLIVALTGVIKAGGFYVPIDPDYPQERIEYIMSNSGASLLLTQSELQDKINFSGKKLLIDNCFGMEENNLNVVNSKNDLIYTIYTSGSTGNPKGVMLTHKNITNFIWGIKNRINFEDKGIILGITTVSFDIFVLETWLPLCLGLKIVLASSAEQLDVTKIIRLLNANNITTIQMTPSRLKPVIQAGKATDFSRLKNILVGGEPLTDEVFKLIKEKTNANIYNMYGPTETAVWSSIADLTNETEITIGEPISNTTFYIVNSHGAVQPFNVEGELCIGGYGLSNGYKDRDELTNEKFIYNDLIKEKIYKTGDKVKFTEDSKLKFIGRIDNQVKYRGYRIEVQDIESNIMKYEGIDKCVVVLNTSGDRLCAYYIGQCTVNERDIKEFLFNKLPNYMIPTYFERIEKLPFTPNGKIDRKKIRELADKVEVIDGNTQIKGEIQEKLCKCFERALDKSNINSDENFFALGGDSLKVIKLTMEIYNEFNVELSYKDVFLSPTISELAKKVSSLLINQYKDNVDLGENYSLLNGKKEYNIFAFPPITGYGLAFNDISKYIDKFSLYAFNYIEDADKIDKYIKDIKNIQSKGPYLLLGFSAGADIVIDIAGKMKDETKIVLMDGFFGKVEKENIDEKLDFFVKYSMEYAKIKSENAFLKNILERKIRNYMNYMADKEKFSKFLDKDIYFIQSEEMSDEEVEEVAKLTTGKLIKYKACGMHFDLLKAEFADKNAQIIQEVFDNAEGKNE